VADDHQRRSRRIHVEGAGDDWRLNRPVREQAPKAPPAPGRAADLGAAPTERLDDSALAARIEEAEATARRQSGDLARRFDALEEAVAARGTEARAAAAAAVDVARRTAESARAGGLRDLEAEVTGRGATLAMVLEQAVADLAPGPAGQDWSAPQAASDGVLPARYLRFGTMRTDDGGRIAALAPLLGTAGWFVEGSAPAVDGLVLATLLRTVAQSPLARLEITVFDPRARGSVGSLTGIRSLVPSALPTPLVDADSLAERLRAILADVAVDTETLVARGVPDLISEWRSTPTPETTQHVVVLLDFPYAIDESVGRLLERIEHAAGRVRPLLLVAAGSDSRPETSWWSGDSMIRMTESGGTWTTSAASFPYPVEADAPPAPDVVASVLELAGGRVREQTGPTVELDDLLSDDFAHPWQHDSRDSLDLAFGRSASGPLELSLRSANPPHPNMLVGGAVGQGKSNLLLDIIYGLAARYSPEELELHLLDFKEGLEFARFGPDASGGHWLPHVRSLSLESDRHFGTEVLRHFVVEMDRRAAHFKDAGHASISAYRTATGEPMPRLLLVIDEFHELFAGDDDLVREAVALMERIARKGRAYGIHLLLASQTLSGIQALAVKEDSIFGQFPIRLSLKNTATESQSILEQGNTAAADLTYRGEVVLNRDFGRSAANQIGLAAYARPEALVEVQRRLWELGHDEPPMVFVASDLAPWPSAPLPTPEEGLPLWIGRPLGVDDRPRCHMILDDADQAVAVLGGNRSHNRRVLRSMLLTALPRLAGGRLVVLDGDGAEADPWCEEIGAVAARHGVAFERSSRDGAAAFLRDDVDAQLQGTGGEGPLLLVGLSLQRLRSMTDVPSSDEEFSFTMDETSGRTVLQRVAQVGPNHGVYLIGAWTNLRNAESDMGPGLPGVSAVATCGIGVEDMRGLVGPHVEAISGEPRVGFYDRTGGGALEVLVPYAAPEGER
jgi:hypothetical protein